MKTTHQKPDFQPCVQGAFGGGLSRAMFFDGMVLSANDLLREQSYWRTKRKLTNRALGEGIIWGLTTEWNPKTRSFTVCPGYALSCCGDDLIVECPETVGEGQLVDPCSEDFRRLMADRFDKCGDECARPDTPVPAALMLEYVECPEEPRSTYEDPCAETARGCRFGAVRETVRLRIVPPPEDCAGPLDRFCRKVAELRAELAAAGTPMPQPNFDLFRSEARFGFALLLADGSVVDGGSERLPLETGASATAGPKNPGTAGQIRLFIDPPDGFVFTKIAVDGADLSGTATVLGWSRTQPLGAAGGSGNHIVSVDTSPLFGPGPSMRVTYQIATTLTNGGIQTTLTVQSVEPLESRPDCAGLIAGDWLTDGDALCRAKATALALVYGVAAGKLAAANCSEGELTEDEEKARKVVAWALCWVGWKALYGFDINQEKAAKLQNCLRALFVEWCEDFAYKGPRCSSSSHGVYLGGVELSAKGRILCFDPWRYRRYVLTGPLLTHWGSQFGLPPIDRVAGRIASWICCVAKADAGTAPAVLAEAGDVIAPLGNGMALAIGSGFAGPKVLGANATLEEVRPMDFAGRLVEAFFGGSRNSFATAADVTVMSVKDSPVHLVARGGSSMSLNVHDAAAPAAAARAIDRVMATRVTGLPPSLAGVVTDFGVNFSETVPITALKPENEVATFEPVLAALDKAELRTVAAVLGAGPEGAADRIRPLLGDMAAFNDPLSVDRAVALVFDRAARLVESSGEAIAAEARNRDAHEPFTRADLPDAVSEVRRASNQFLKKGSGTTLASLRDVAARTMATRT